METVRIRDCIVTKHGGSFTLMFSEGVMGNSSNADTLAYSFISGSTGASVPRLFSNTFSHVNQLLEKAEGTL